MKTAVKSARSFTPSAAAMARFSLAARTSMPKRVRVMSHHSASRTDRAHEHEKQIVRREHAPGDVDGPAQAGGTRAEQILGPPGSEHRVLDDQYHAEGCEQLQQFRRMVQTPQQLRFDQRAEHARPAARPSNTATQ